MNAPTLGQFGRYEVLQRLAVGGMGEIFLARQVSIKGFERLAIIKTLLTSGQDDEERVDMFLAEARIAALLNHPSIVQIYDLGEEDGTYYIVMEYVEGDTVGALLTQAVQQQRHNRWAFVTLLAQAARALHYAHHHLDTAGNPLQLVHRDISPQNIMVRRDGNVKVVDFGIAKVANMGASRTRTGMVKGKLAYMPPEQIRGDDLDGRADLFALAVVAWETTMGRRMFTGLQDYELSVKLLDGNLPRPRDLVPDYPPELEALVMKALSTDRNLRFQTGNEMAEAMEALVASVPAAQKVNLADYTDSLIGARVQKRKEAALATPGGRAAFSSPGMPAQGGTPGSQRISFSNPGTPGALPRPDAASGTVPPAGRTPTGQRVVFRTPTNQRQAAAPPPPMAPPAGDSEQPTVVSGVRSGLQPAVTEALTQAATAVAPPAAPPARPMSRGVMAALGAVMALVGAAAAWVGLGLLTPRLDPVPAVAPALPGTPPPASAAPGPSPAAPTPEPLPAGRLAPAPAPEPDEDSAKPAARPDRKSPRPGKGPEPRPAPSPAPQPAPQPAPAAATGEGLLTLSSTPWAKAFVDGKEVGTTPVFKLSLSAGRHTVLLVNDTEGLKKTLDVTIKAGAEERLKVPLR